MALFRDGVDSSLWLFGGLLGWFLDWVGGLLWSWVLFTWFLGRSFLSWGLLGWSWSRDFLFHWPDG